MSTLYLDQLHQVAKTNRSEIIVAIETQNPES